MKEKKAIRALVPLIKLYPWFIPSIISLGVLSSLAEGLGITMFIPFLQSLNQSVHQSTSTNFLIEFASGLFSFLPSGSRPLIIPLFIFGCILLKNLLACGNLTLFGWFNSRISHRLRSDTFSQLLSSSGSYLDTVDSGTLLNTLATETWRTSEALESLVKLIINGCTVVVFSILLLLISWQLTLLVGLIMVLISIIIQFLTRRVKVLGIEAVESNATLAKRMHQGVVGIRDIWAFGRERFEQERFDRASELVRSTFMKLGILSGVVNPLYEVLSAFLVLGILVVVLLQDRTALPILLTFLLMLYRLQPQVQQLGSNRVRFLSLVASVREVISFLDYSDKHYISSGWIPFQGLKHAISLESVSFRYNSQRDLALRDISIVIPQGKTTALVGPSGAGKSTLVNLICRFYEVTEGAIFADGRPLLELDLASWRSRIAIVSQHSHIFNATILENIAYGRLDAKEEEVVAAAKQAHAHEFIQPLTRGYDTCVGEQGIRLSGGQRQRIALARAIVRNPDILILDEATSSLDIISENLIQEALNALKQDRTVIIIAHRFSTIEQADEIVVLKDGCVVEQGHLRNLMQLNGLFARLYRLQHSNTKSKPL